MWADLNVWDFTTPNFSIHSNFGFSIHKYIFKKIKTPNKHIWRVGFKTPNLLKKL